MQPLVITAKLSLRAQHALDALRSQYFPTERNFLSAHLTLFHALPQDVLGQAEQFLQQQTQRPSPGAQLSRLFALSRGFAVLVESDGLCQVHGQLQKKFWPYLTAQDRQKLRPHVTLQNKVHRTLAQRDLRRAQAQFVSQATAVTALQLWRYDHGPWMWLRDFPFLQPLQG